MGQPLGARLGQAAGRPGWALLILALLATAVYHGSFDNGFHYDDEHSIVRNPHLRDLGNLPAFFVDPTLFSEDPAKAMYRPVLLCSLALDHALGGYRVGGYHAVNLGIHVLAAWMVYWLAALRHSRGAGVLAAALFVVHPLATEPVNYISSRSESLAALFCLAALNLHLRGRPALGLAAYAAGLLTKPTALALPLLLLVWERWESPHPRPGWRTAGARLVPHLVVSLGYLLLIQQFVRQAYGPQQVRPLAAQVLTQLKALGYYLKLLLVPHPLSVEHAFHVSPSAGWVHLAVLALVGSLVWLAATRRATWPRIALAGLVFPLLPVALVPLNVLVSEHRLYLPLALGMAGLGALLAGSRPLAGRAGVAVAAALLAVWGCQSALRTRDWQDDLSLWTAALHVAPTMPRVHFLLGEAHRRMGDVAAAETAYLEADRLFGGSAEVQLSLAALYLEHGQGTRARHLLEGLLRTHADHPQVLYNLGLALREEDPARAAAVLERAWRLRPDWLEAGMALASVLESRGELVRARQALEDLTARYPGSADAWSNLGQVRAREGEYDLARAAWSKALELEPAHPQARANMLMLKKTIR